MSGNESTVTKAELLQLMKAWDERLGKLEMRIQQLSKQPNPEQSNIEELRNMANSWKSLVSKFEANVLELELDAIKREADTA